MTRRVIVAGLALLLCAGCVSVPPGPTITVMPGPDKSFEQFQADDAVCRQWASQQAGGPPQTAFAQGAGTGAAIGTIAGAGLGAAIGAGGGLLGGTAIGANAGMSAGYGFQRRYDRAYEQCMYAKGNDIPRESQPAYPPPRR